MHVDEIRAIRSRRKKFEAKQRELEAKLAPAVVVEDKAKSEKTKPGSKKRAGKTTKAEKTDAETKECAINIPSETEPDGTEPIN